ncbi:hypothetical protein C8Q77DRAFT_644348 [Trametes polyzona]|nr:hypothetical protein C8Q77DRAFT_644348 [Trametes polyzona]
MHTGHQRNGKPRSSGPKKRCLNTGKRCGRLQTRSPSDPHCLAHYWTPPPLPRACTLPRSVARRAPPVPVLALGVRYHHRLVITTSSTLSNRICMHHWILAGRPQLLGQILYLHLSLLRDHSKRLQKQRTNVKHAFPSRTIWPLRTSSPSMSPRHSRAIALTWCRIGRYVACYLHDRSTYLINHPGAHTVKARCASNTFQGRT